MQGSCSDFQIPSFAKKNDDFFGSLETLGVYQELDKIAREISRCRLEKM